MTTKNNNYNSNIVMLSLTNLPDPLVLETVMAFLGPIDLMPTLGSTNKRYRELAKSDILWQQFSSQRRHSQILHAMVIDVKKCNKLQDFRYESIVSPSPTTNDNGTDGRMMPSGGDNQPQQYRSKAANSQIRRICSWVQAFQQENNKNNNNPLLLPPSGTTGADNSTSSSSSYENYISLHAENYWPGSRHFVGRIYCRQRRDPIIQADLLDGCRWDGSMLGGVRRDNDCRCRTTVHCQWPGCGVGYCDTHTEKTAWEKEAFLVGQKWNRCSICHLDLCQDCNETGQGGGQNWIEPRFKVSPRGGSWQSVCVDCRKNFP